MKKNFLKGCLALLVIFITFVSTVSANEVGFSPASRFQILQASIFGAIRESVLNFLGIDMTPVIEEKTAEAPSPAVFSTTTSSFVPAPSSPQTPSRTVVYNTTAPTVVNNYYTTNTYRSGGSTSGLALKASRKNDELEDQIIALDVRLTSVEGMDFSGGGSGTSTVATSSVRAMFSSSAPINYDSSSGIFSIASGFDVPLAASSTQWAAFYVAPSSRIAAGTGLSWSGNTLNVNSSSFSVATSSYASSAATSTYAATAGNASNLNGQAAAYYLARANHTGTQATSTISDFNGASRAAFSAGTGLSYDSSAGTFVNTGITSTSSLGLTTSNIAEGSRLYFTDIRARDAISENLAAIDYVSGVFSLNSSYSIPLAASSTQWNSFFTTPSSRVTAGAGLAWTGNSLANTGVTSIGGMTGDIATSSLGISGGSSQWTTSGSNIYYTTGNVGVGTTTPTAKVAISTGAAGTIGQIIQGAASQSASFLEWRNNSGATLGSVAASGDLNLGTFSNGVKINFASPNNQVFIALNDAPILSRATERINWVTDSYFQAQGFYTAGLERMMIDGSGNIGLGTSSPSSKLSVAGDINLTGAIRVAGDAGLSGYVLQSTGSGVRWVATSSLAISAATSSGGNPFNQNLNTSDSPSFANLSVTGSGTSTFATNISISGHIVPTADNTYSLGGPDKMWRDVYIGPGSLYINGQKVLEEQSNNIVVSADINQSVILKTLGTGDVELNPSGTGLIYLKSNVQVSGGKSFVSSDGSAIPFTNGLIGGNVKVSGSTIESNTLNGGIALAATGTGAVYVTNGNFGIGTTSPSSKLSVAGDINLTGALRIAGNAGTSGYVLQSTGSGVSWVATSSLGISGGSATSTSSQWTTSGSDIYYTTGNVGIGTTSPAVGLVVAQTTPEVRLATANGLFAGFKRTSADALSIYNQISGISSASNGFYPNSNTSNITFSSITLGANSTLCGWYYLTGSTSNYNPIWGSSGTNEMYYGSGASAGKVAILKSNVTIFQSTSSVSANSWHFLCIVDDGSSIKAYYDNVDMGNSVGYTTLSGMSITRTNQGLNANNFVGRMDELSIFSRALSPAELTTLYNSGTGTKGDTAVSPFNSGLVLGYHLDHSSGTSVTDFSGNGRTGTVNGGASWGTGKVLDTSSGVEYAIVSGSQSGQTALSGESLVFNIGTSTEYARLSSTGNFGIGTTSPSHKLSVAGDINFTGTLYQNGIPFNAGSITNATNYDVASGNASQFIFTNTALGADVGGSIGIGGTWSGSSQVPFGYIWGKKENSSSGDAKGYLALGTRSGNSTALETLRITSQGNVGIGTTSPSHKFSVAGDINLTGALRVAGDAGTSGYILQSTGSGVQWIATSSAGLGTVNSGTVGQIAYYSANGTSVSGTSTMYVSGEKVALGTTTITSMFEAAPTAVGTAATVRFRSARNSGDISTAQNIIEFTARNSNVVLSSFDFLGRLNVNPGQLSNFNTTTADAAIAAAPRTTTSPALILRGLSSQNSNMLEIQNSTPTTVASIDSSGNGYFAGLKVGTTGALGGLIHSYSNTSGSGTTHGYFENASASGRTQLIVSSGTYPNNFFSLMTHGASFGSNNYLSDGANDAGLGILLGQGSQMTKFAIGTYDATPVTLFTNNTQRILITSAGSVGIGTTSPSHLLSVAGDINLTGAIRVAGDAGTSGYVLQTTGSGVQWAAQQWTTSSGDIYRGTGNVGIGTAFPQGVLDVGAVTSLIPTLTSNTGANGTSSCSSTYVSSSCWHALDGNTTTVGWLTNATQTGTFQYQFTSGQVVTRYSIVPWSVDTQPAALRSPKTWTFEGSNNGSSWTVLDTQTNYSSWTQYQASTFSVPNTTSYTYYRLNISANGGNTYLGIQELSMYSGSSAFLVKSTGNVGIGTTSPSHLLSVAGDINLTGAIRVAGDAGTSGYILQTTGTASRWVATSTLGLGAVSSGTLGQIAYFAANGTAVSGSSTLILKNQNVGIGTTSPVYKLSVSTTNDTDGLFVAGSGDNVNMVLQNTGTNGHLYSLVSTGGSSALGQGKFAVYDSTSATTRFLIDENGNVGIGINAPEKTLHVKGGDGFGVVAKFENDSQSCRINVVLGSLDCSSDERLKKDIDSLVASSSIEKILGLRPVSYQWKTDNASSSKRYGFIAQEMEEIFPELVQTDDVSELKSISMTGLIPFLVNAVQDLAKQFASVIHFGEDGTTVQTDKLCVGTVCVTQEEFLLMLQNNGGAPASSEPDPDLAPEPAPEENGGGEPEDGGEVSEEAPAPEETPESEPQNEPEPEPAPEPSPEPSV